MDSPKSSQDILGSTLDLLLKMLLSHFFFLMSDDFESSVGTSCINFLQVLFNLYYQLELLVCEHDQFR